MNKNKLIFTIAWSLFFCTAPTIAFAQSSTGGSDALSCCICLAIILLPIAAIVVLVYMKYTSKNNTLNNIKILGESKDTQAIDKLVHYLSDLDPAIQKSAATALQKYDVTLIGPMLACIIKNQYNNIKAANITGQPIDIKVVTKYDANNALIRMVMVDIGPGTISSLVQLLNSDDAVLRNTIKRVLVEFRTLSVEPLISELKNPDVLVRVNALNVLGEIKDIRAAEPIMEALKDGDMDVRNAAAMAIRGFNITTTPKEKETIREIVKIPCSYCGALVEIMATKCPTCGAPLKT